MVGYAALVVVIEVVSVWWMSTGAAGCRAAGVAELGVTVQGISQGLLLAVIHRLTECGSEAGLVAAFSSWSGRAECGGGLDFGLSRSPVWRSKEGHSSCGRPGWVRSSWWSNRPEPVSSPNPFLIPVGALILT